MWVRTILLAMAALVLLSLVIHVVIWALLVGLGLVVLLEAWSLHHRHPFAAVALGIVGVLILFRFGGFWFWFMPVLVVAALLVAVYELVWGRRHA